MYSGVIKQQEALDRLKSDYSMAEGSAADYITNFKKMMQGDLYKRTSNKEATDYSLKNIYQDYGLDALKRAVASVEAHIEYYEGLKRGKLNATRKVLQIYKALIADIDETQTIYPDELQTPEKYWEGAKKLIIVDCRERNPKARKKMYFCSRCKMQRLRV